METKERLLKSWITSLVGLAFMIFGLWRLYKLINDPNFSLAQLLVIVAVVLVGGFFLWAKDTDVLSYSKSALGKIGIGQKDNTPTDPKP